VTEQERQKRLRIDLDPQYDMQRDHFGPPNVVRTTGLRPSIRECIEWVKAAEVRPKRKSATMSGTLAEP
jgi:hypothetical protein